MPATAGRTLLWTLLGGIIGTAFGEILARFLPANGLTRFFTASVPLGTPHPLTLDIRVLELTLGAMLRVNFLGIVGAIIVLVAQFRHS
jgi:uncharacterized membrane protein YeaQ/YmgE (transglycosylase-associated protein family)